MGLQGSKIRSTYIAFAQKEKARLGAQILSLTEEIKVKEKEVERIRSMYDPLYDPKFRLTHLC